MASQIDIINLALNKLGQDVTIAALSDQAKAARVFGRLWEPMLDVVLADRNWGWATKSQAAALSVEGAQPGWQYRYSRPNDCITLVAVTDETGLRSARRASLFCDPEYVRRIWGCGAYDFEQSFGDTETTVNTDVEEAYFVYVTRVTDTGRFPPHFVDTLAWRLAAEGAVPMIGEVGMRMKREMLDGYRVALSDAGAQDRSQSLDQRIEMPAAVAARA